MCIRDRLKADATQDKIQVLCEEAKKYDFASVCVNTYWVAYCAKLLNDSDVKVCTVVGLSLIHISSFPSLCHQLSAIFSNDAV